MENNLEKKNTETCHFLNRSIEQVSGGKIDVHGLIDLIGSEAAITSLAEMYVTQCNNYNQKIVVFGAAKEQIIAAKSRRDQADDYLL